MSLVSMHLVWLCTVLTLAAGVVSALLLGGQRGRFPRTTAVVCVVVTATLLLGTLAGSANVRMGWFKTAGDLWRTVSGGEDAQSGSGVVPLPAPGAPDPDQEEARGNEADVPLPSSLAAHPGDPSWTTTFSRVEDEGVWRAQVSGPASGLQRSVTVWTPPGYSPTSGTTYDVVMFLHGFPGSDSGVVKAMGVNETFTRMSESGEMPPAIFVVADLSMSGAPPTCIDIQGQPPVETFLTQDLVQSIRTNFPNTSGMRSGWVLSGISAGAYCAPVLYLRHQDQFWGAVAMSGYDEPELGPLSGAEESVRRPFTVSRMVQDRNRTPARLWLAATSNDPDAMSLLDNVTQVAGAEDDVVTHVDTSGGHSWTTWAQQFPLGLAWWSQGGSSGKTVAGPLQSGAGQSGAAQSGDAAHGQSNSLLSGLARAFAIDGWGTQVGSVLLALGLLVGLALVGPRTVWRGRMRPLGFLFRLMGVVLVSAAVCVSVVVLANGPQGFFSSWTDLVENWGMFF